MLFSNGKPVLSHHLKNVRDVNGLGSGGPGPYSDSMNMIGPGHIYGPASKSLQLNLQQQGLNPLPAAPHTVISPSLRKSNININIILSNIIIIIIVSFQLCSDQLYEFLFSNIFCINI